MTSGRNGISGPVYPLCSLAGWCVKTSFARPLILEDTLYTSLQDWADGLFRPSVKRDDVLMRPRDILEYTQGIRYFIGVTEQRAIERFQHYLDQLSLP
jgi:hypothetical protein